MGAECASKGLFSYVAVLLALLWVLDCLVCNVIEWKLFEHSGASVNSTVKVPAFERKH